MAKSATFFTVLFVFALILAAFETPMVVEGKWCDVPSGTWSGHCGSSAKCDKQCREWEGFEHRACHYQFPSVKCFCKKQC